MYLKWNTKMTKTKNCVKSAEKNGKKNSERSFHFDDSYMY